jgi:hypothetical protein
LRDSAEDLPDQHGGRSVVENVALRATRVTYLTCNPISMAYRGRCTVTIFLRRTKRLDDLTMTTETAANRYRREAEECRRNAERALRPIDREAWLRLAGDWERLAESAELVRPANLRQKLA